MLAFGPLGHAPHTVFTEAHMKALLGDDAFQDALVWAVGAVLEHGLLAG